MVQDICDGNVGSEKSFQKMHGKAIWDGSPVTHIA